MWVEISYWDEPGMFFARKLIDDIKIGRKGTVEYEGKWYLIIDGIYGHCKSYPRGFKVKLVELYRFRETGRTISTPVCKILNEGIFAQ